MFLALKVHGSLWHFVFHILLQPKHLESETFSIRVFKSTYTLQTTPLNTLTFPVQKKLSVTTKIVVHIVNH